MKKEHLEILNAGVDAWNKWRKENPTIIPDLRGVDLRDRRLQGINLCLVDLADADLRDATLDFSCLPLWCGSFGIRCDNQLVFQLAYHICRLKCDSIEFTAIKEALTPYANKFHRVGRDCRHIG